MIKFQDYMCKHNDDMNYLDVMKHFNFKAEEVHTSNQLMVKVSKEMSDGRKICFLPFCHTVEGDAMGALIQLGDCEFGPRSHFYSYDLLEDLLQVKGFDLSSGRINEVIKASSHLLAEGYEVVVNISGPLTILNLLIDPVKVYKGFRKQADLIKEILLIIERNLLMYIEALLTKGVRVFSYGDASGGISIVGPRLYQQQVEWFTHRFLESIEKLFDKKALMVLCPKVSYGLVAHKKASWSNISVGTSDYMTAIQDSIGKTCFVGETCIKNNKYRLRNLEIKGLSLNR
ncbi:MAG: hypothetical protein JEZ08_01700 [Clostridiales bacterium]|nr:hypothetical protein [Clostridiales bacterium]